VAAIALAVLFFLSRRPDVAQYGSAMLSIIALGAVVGFLPFNFGRAKAFLGDTGSVFLGFLIGVIAIISGGKVATAFLVLAIPFLDAVIVFGSRLLHQQSPFQADKTHLHHRLLALGFKQWQIVGLFYVVTLAFGLIALNTQTLGKYQAALAALVLMVGLILVYSYVGKRKN
jgi:UDP-GlcNAc:undecaprenyl-phosphate GlcNAc-1-phosphate transferase